MRVLVHLLATTAVLASIAGCIPRTFVRKNPGEHDRGIRYYRPKPYLMLKPLVVDKAIQPNMVELSIEYLPDFSEEYSIHVRSGFGINETNITLEDGWNLTGLNVSVDSQTDENIQAISELLGSAAKLTGGGLEGGFPVKASNVPLGLYEAVISPDRHGKKRLYGFRYVGFFPFAACPLESCGSECQPCSSGAIYGLVWENNAMVFRLIGELPCHVEVSRDGQTEDGKLLPAPDLEREDMAAPIISLDDRPREGQ